MSIHFPNELVETRTGKHSPRALPRRNSFYRSHGKQIFETTLVLLTAVFTIPIVAFLAFLIAFDGSNPFYRQKRIGRNGTVFTIWKLRTMVRDADHRLEEYLELNPEARVEWESKQKLKGDPRVTRLGRFLRKTSLDELPQLWNVFRGDMSLVGPRPIMVEQRAIYPGTSYFTLRPGITGLWQISDRNDCTFTDRANFDTYYELSLSLGEDIRILVRTVRAVLTCTGH